MLRSLVMNGRLTLALQGLLNSLRYQTEQHSFARNVGIMLAGTVSGQTISLLIAPLLTRLFTPAQFGDLGVYSSVLMMIGMISSLGLELAVPICLAEAECANLLALCWISLAATTSLIGTLILV